MSSASVCPLRNQHEIRLLFTWATCVQSGYRGSSGGETITIHRTYCACFEKARPKCAFRAVWLQTIRVPRLLLRCKRSSNWPKKWENKYPAQSRLFLNTLRSKSRFLPRMHAVLGQNVLRWVRSVNLRTLALPDCTRTPSGSRNFPKW